MKRTLMWVAFIMVTLFAQAQEIYLGGGISLWHNTDLEKTSFSISPEIGYVFSEKWAVGAEIAYAHNSYEGALRLLQMRLSLRRMLVFLSMKTRSCVCSSTWVWEFLP